MAQSTPNTAGDQVFIPFVSGKQATQQSVQAAASPNIVISQVYGGGGNSGATYTNDFIELFNRGAALVDLSGWSVQYASATGPTWQKTDLSGTVQPGQYYLIQVSSRIRWHNVVTYARCDWNDCNEWYCRQGGSC
ncbi:MAG: lamin tail domain-containing protein [Caldilineaceae bacterium]